MKFIIIIIIINIVNSLESKFNLRHVTITMFANTEGNRFTMMLNDVFKIVFSESMCAYEMCCWGKSSARGGWALGAGELRRVGGVVLMYFEILKV